MVQSLSNEERMIRDRLIMGTSDSAARARIQRDTDCRLERALQTLRLIETSTKQMIKMATESEEYCT